MEVSVVIPVYNGARTVARALQSIKDQTLSPTEVIIVDDGSQDDTSEIVTQFIGDRSLTGWYVFRQTNQGAAAARDAGVRAARCSHIALLDADDAWLPKHLERALDALVSGQLDIVGSRLINERCSGDSQDFSCKVVGKRGTLYRNPYFTSSVVFRRAVYFDVGGFDTKKRFAEDYKLWLAFVWTDKRAGLLKSVDAKYRPDRMAPRGLSSQRWRMERGELENYYWMRRAGFISTRNYLVACGFSLLKYIIRIARNR